MSKTSDTKKLPAAGTKTPTVFGEGQWQDAVDRRFVWCKNSGDYLIAKFCGLRREVEGEDVRNIVDIDLISHNLTMEQASNINCCMYCKGNLYRRLASLGLKTGDTVKITFNGKMLKKTAYGQVECNDFSVAVKL